MFSRRIAAIAGLATSFFAFAGMSERAAAQATYNYTGNNFTLFSCGPSSPGPGTLDCSTPAPTNPDTSYTATDHVTARLTLASPLGANFAFSDVHNLPGFSLTLSDGQQTVSTPVGAGQSVFAFVSTDASGNINQWELGINTGGFDDGGIATFNDASVSDVFDQGTISCCDPSPPGNLAINFSMPGTWNGGGGGSPSSSVNNLIGMIANPSLGLTAGQISSLTDKLNNVLGSLQAGLDKQAINQLKAFISSVQSAVKNQKISAPTGTTLIGAANAIIAVL
jgi:hypothetical protein